VIRRPRPAAHYRAEDIPTLLTDTVRESIACRLAHDRAMKEMAAGTLTRWDAVIRLRGEYQRAWRRPRVSA